MEARASDWFVAGTWTPARRPRRRVPSPPDGSGPNGTRHFSPTEVAELTTVSTGRLDPTTLSVSDFQRVAAETRGDFLKMPSADHTRAKIGGPDPPTLTSNKIQTGQHGLGGGEPFADDGLIVGRRGGDEPPLSSQPQDGGRIVVDRSGNRIIIGETGEYLIAPLDWNAQNAIAFGQSLKDDYELTLMLTGDDASAAIAEDLKLALSYKSGAQFDLQINYNGNGGKGPFREQLTDAAAYSFGLTAAAAGYSFDQAIAGAGIYNLLKSLFTGVNVDGPWWNDPARVALIRKGFDDYASGRFQQ